MKTSLHTIVRAASLTLLIGALPTLAYAHPGHAGGLAYGLAHPFGGLDHLAAMVAVGLWASQLGGRAAWLVPLSFVAAMALGGLLGVAAVALPFVETGILLSLLVLGAAIALGFRPAAGSGALLVAGFALFHGHAHGTGMAANLAGLAYGLGFAGATILLQGGGLGAVWLLQRRQAERLTRLAGLAIAAGGVYLALGGS